MLSHDTTNYMQMVEYKTSMWTSHKRTSNHEGFTTCAILSHRQASLCRYRLNSFSLNGDLEQCKWLQLYSTDRCGYFIFQFTKQYLQFSLQFIAIYSSHSTARTIFSAKSRKKSIIYRCTVKAKSPSPTQRLRSQWRPYLKSKEFINQFTIYNPLASVHFKTVNFAHCQEP